MPTIQVAHEAIATEQIPILLHDAGRELETNEFQVVLGDEGFDLGYRESMLLNVKQQVAAFAGAEEIAVLGDAPERGIQEVLPAAANVVRARAVASLENECAGRHNAAARELAVEAYSHESAGSQQLEQDAPARLHIGKMMQHAAGIDQVEASVDRFELEEIGLGILDPAYERDRRLPLGVAKAG